MEHLYAFVYRGVLADAALDRVGRMKRRHLSEEELRQIRTSLCIDLLDEELLDASRLMAAVYAALHTFENMIRAFVMKAMAEAHQEAWWEEVPERVRKRVKGRMEEEAKFRWHGTRGASEMNYCDFGDLSSIIVTNWTTFEDVVGNLEWAKQVLGTLEKSRNVVMHGGTLDKEDIERIGINIRDWIRQVG